MNLVPDLPALAVATVRSGVPRPLRAAVEAAAGPVLDPVEVAADRTAPAPVPGRSRAPVVPQGHSAVPPPRAHPGHRGTPHTRRPRARAQAAAPWPVGAWRYLLFQHVPRRASDLFPGSADRDAITRALRRLATLLTLAAARLRAEDR